MHGDQGDGQHDEPVGDELARVDLADEKTDHRHHAHHHHSGGREHKAGELRSVAEQCLYELRDEDRSAIEGEAENEHQQKADGEVAALEQREVQDRSMAFAKLFELPPDHGDKRYNHRNGEEGDKTGGKPVVFLSLVEHELERPKGEAKQTETEK